MGENERMRHEHALQLGDVLERQSELNLAVGKALQAVALTADLHESEMAELRDEVLALANRVESLTRSVAVGFKNVSNELHSVKVPDGPDDGLGRS